MCLLKHHLNSQVGLEPTPKAWPSRVETRRLRSVEGASQQEDVLVLDIVEVPAMVRPVRAMRRLRARRLVHLGRRRGRSCRRRPPLPFLADNSHGMLADAGEHGDAAVVLGYALDHLLDETVYRRPRRR